MSTQIRELNVAGVPAPFYVLRAKQALDGLPAGQILALTTDAPNAPREIRTWLEHAGHQLVSNDVSAGTHRFLIRRL
ncbi:MAG: sulfurtransferase TusA family protein [Candidatus Macondimonas sp.]